MEVLFAIAVVIVAIVVFMLVVVIFGGINALHKNGHEPEPEPSFIHCPYCVGTLEIDAKFTDPESDRRGLLYCRQCDITFKLYARQDGLSVLEEVFGTPVINDTSDDHSPVQDRLDDGH